MLRPHVVGFLDEMLKTENKLRVEEVLVPEKFPPTRISMLPMRSQEFVVLAVRGEEAWTFNPGDAFTVRAGDVIVFMASPAGRIEMTNNLRNRIG